MSRTVIQLTPNLEQLYEDMFQDMGDKTNWFWKHARAFCSNTILKNKSRYQTVQNQTGVPWQVIAVIHTMESNCNFDAHLHNGDSLQRRTRLVPVMRPVLFDEDGLLREGPFTWEESALDALTYMGLHNVQNWTVGRTLYELERYNGFGYMRRGINTPYLWSGTKWYSKGKYVRDGVFDPEAVSKQMGGAILLDVLEFVKSQPRFFFNTKGEDAIFLQQMLNSLGHKLKVDGWAGYNTSSACKDEFGFYLKGDPRIA